MDETFEFKHARTRFQNAPLLPMILFERDEARRCRNARRARKTLPRLTENEIQYFRYVRARANRLSDRKNFRASRPHRSAHIQSAGTRHFPSVIFASGNWPAFPPEKSAPTSYPRKGLQKTARYSFPVPQPISKISTGSARHNAFPQSPRFEIARFVFHRVVGRRPIVVCLPIIHFFYFKDST